MHKILPSEYLSDCGVFHIPHITESWLTSICWVDERSGKSERERPLILDREHRCVTLTLTREKSVAKGSYSVGSKSVTNLNDS